MAGASLQAALDVQGSQRRAAAFRQRSQRCAQQGVSRQGGGLVGVEEVEQGQRCHLLLQAILHTAPDPGG